MASEAQEQSARPSGNGARSSGGRSPTSGGRRSGGRRLDILVQSRRNGEAAIRFLRRSLMEMHYAPEVIVTDELKG